MTGKIKVLLISALAVFMIGCGSKDDAVNEKPIDKAALGTGEKGPAVSKPSGEKIDPEQKAAIEFEQGKK